MHRIANIISRVLCFHTGPQLIRTTRTRLYLECMSCGDCSAGIQVEGF